MRQFPKKFIKVYGLQTLKRRCRVALSSYAAGQAGKAKPTKNQQHARANFLRYNGRVLLCHLATWPPATAPARNRLTSRLRADMRIC